VLLVMKLHMDETPVCVSMLVYIDLASAENSSAPAGSEMSLRLLSTVEVFLM
jgi:hypothetical protein